jgi:hypothetical protein
VPEPESDCAPPYKQHPEPPTHLRSLVKFTVSPTMRCSGRLKLTRPHLFFFWPGPHLFPSRLFVTDRTCRTPTKDVRASPAGQRISPTPNRTFWFVCVEIRIKYGSRSGPPSRCAQRRDAQSYFLIWPARSRRVLARFRQSGDCFPQPAVVSHAGTCFPLARHYKNVSPTTRTCHHNNEHHVRASSS